MTLKGHDVRYEEILTCLKNQKQRNVQSTADFIHFLDNTKLTVNSQAMCE